MITQGMIISIRLNKERKELALNDTQREIGKYAIARKDQLWL